MKRSAIAAMTVEQLIDRFLAVALDQDQAIFDDDNAKYRRLFDEMEVIRAELKSRAGDQRRALLPQLKHSNAQVRLKAAITLLAVAPEAARQALQVIHERKEYPQAADAFGMIRALDRGTYIPS